MTSQGGVRAPLSGSGIAQAVTGSRARGYLARGAATGSYEGLPDDGRHPGSTERLAFTRAPSRRPRQLRSLRAAASRGAARPRAKATGRSEDEEKRQGCQRLGLRRRRGSNRPAPVANATGQRRAKARRSGRGCREAPLPPVTPQGPQSPGGLPSARALERAGNARGTGSRRFVRLAEVGRMHRPSSRPGSCKARRSSRTVAGRKRAAALTRGARGEMANRCTSLREFDTNLRRGGLWVTLAGSRHDRRRSRSSTVRPSRVGRPREDLRLAGQSAVRFETAQAGRTERDSASDGKEAGSGVPAGDQEKRQRSALVR